MSEESTIPDLVELTRRIFQAFSGDDVDAVLSFYAPDAVHESPPLGTRFEGVGAIRGFYEDWFAAYEEHEFEVEQILDLGCGVIFAVARLYARPTGSIGRVRTRMALVSELVDGKIARVIVYYDVDEARAAAERLAAERG